MSRLTLISSVLFLFLLLGLPGSAIGDEPPAGDTPPAGDPPPGGDEQPAGDEPAPAPAKEGDDEPVAPAPAPESDSEPAPEGPGGMTYVRPGIGVIGTSSREIGQLVGGRDESTVQIFFFETPQHRVQMGPYFIDRYEVSNAQYLLFLQATAAVTYDTSSGSLANLDEIAAALLNLKEKDRENPRLRYWHQLYTANKDVLWEAFKTRIDELRVFQKKKEGEEQKLDEDKTAENFRFAPLPRGIKLSFYTLRPPGDWPGIQPAPGQFDHPVKDVSYLDAQRFAEWAGKHIPTEQEWEYAARGPEGFVFPWGNEFPLDKEEAMKRGNWAAHYINNRYEPTTVAVDDIPGSQSWCGCLNMVGNVAEWTSSWFEAYPGYDRESRWNTRLGHVIKVVRGGHAANREMLVLRPAARNFIGAGPKAPPYPGNKFPWVGFRCAWYAEAGRNHLEPIISRATRGKRVKQHMLALDQFRGAVTERLAEPGSTVENHVYVLGGSSSIVLVPLKSVLWNEGDSWATDAYKNSRRWRSVRDLTKRTTETDNPRVVLGVFHCDTPLEKVFVRKPPEPGEERERKGRGRRRAPEVIQGTAAPDTYILAMWHGRLCLANTSLEFVGFISPEKAQIPIASIVKKDPAEVPAPKLEVDSLDDTAEFDFYVPLGGNKTDPNIFVRIRGKIRFELGSLDMKGQWRTNN